MIRFLYNILQIACGILVAVCILVIFMLCLFTPEKTKHGTYTDIYKYWTDDVYLCRNFECPVKGTK